MNPCPDIGWLVDHAKYPLARTGTAVLRRFVAECRSRLAQTGVVALHGYVPAKALGALREEWTPLLDHAYYTDIRHNCFLMPPDEAYPPGHPRNRTVYNNKGGVADDLIPAGGLLRQLYDWLPWRRFLAEVVGEARLHPLADPLSSLNINVHQAGQVQGWHFDVADFAVTLMLQTSERGGLFKYSRVLRDAGGADFEAIDRVLDGDETDVSTLEIGDGTLVIFRGHRSLHSVTAPEGKRPRVNAILSYAPEEGVRLAEHTCRLFYGRVG